MSDFLVFDVESVGLHGEGYAFGYVVIGRDGVEVESGRFACPPSNARGDMAGRAWIAANIPPIEPIYRRTYEVRDAFWSIWMRWKQAGATLFAECCWPVEARFLTACVDDDPKRRGWDGPYPLHDVASVRFAAGLDPLASVDRRSDELPAHDPLCDARQSARLLIEAINITMASGTIASRLDARG